MANTAKNRKNTKTVSTMPPTLLVGLGGTGCEIVGAVYELANDAQKKFLQFAFLDTDANELRERKFKAPEAHTVQTSRKITVGQALRDDPEAYKNTFPINPQLMNKPLTEGAGQIRAVSKLAFDMCVREGRLGGLHDAINELQKLNSDDMEQSIRVLIVSTLVGGTGSGILLPVAMYLRNYLENHCNKKPIIRAFCLLPEVFFTGDPKTEIEKSNLRTNAYATLRELDAFMLRADSKPGSEIRKRFGLKMPRPGTVDQYEEYNLNPLDYCFLFDAQNINGETLDDLEDYKRHAADCIYASSISRLHKRLNSSEDNTILERCAQQGRNRYCGVGMSKLVYPFEAARDYIALNWMSQAMTADWMRYDNKVEDEKRKRQKRRASGIIQPPIDEREVYCNFVESDNEAKNYFGFSIVEECYSLDKSGTFFTEARWMSFFKELTKSIKNISEDNVDTEMVSIKLGQILAKLNNRNTSGFGTDFATVSQMLKILFNQTRKMAQSKAAIVADGMFSVDNYDKDNKARLEHWLFKDGVPLHPNSARYLLYKLEAEIKEALRKLSSPVEEGEELTQPAATEMGGGDDADESDIYGDLSTSFPEIEKQVSEFFTAKNYVKYGDDSGRAVDITTFANSLNPKKKSDFVENAKQIVDDFTTQVNNIIEYYKIYLRVAVLEEASKFIDNLCKNYETFYKMLDSEIKSVDYKIERIANGFENVVGDPVIYVCASNTCLSALLEDCPNVIDSIQLTKEFRTEIFNSIYMKADADADIQTLDQKQEMRKLVKEDILAFWRKSALEQYGENIDMDIIDAIVKEAKYEEGCTAPNEQLRYADKKYREALTLSAPFIDKPVGQPYEIVACGMSSTIEDKNNLPKMRILELFGHYEKDSLMDRYQILTMTALYNLKASDLKKFASADDHPADPRVEGSYFKDYVTRIDNVLPDAEKSNIITPHLDRRWHFAGVLPDFEDKTEIMRQTEAQKAFLIALAYGYVRFDRDQYKFVDDKNDFISEQIIVRDGLCDKLHEVYDALNISRPLVRDFLNRFKKTTDDEIENAGVANRDFTYSKLYRALDGNESLTDVSEDNLNKDRGMKLNKYPFIPRVSFFEIPLLYKTSVGNGTFDDDDAVTMLHNFINTIDEYLTNFYDDNIRRVEYLVQWLDEQTALMFNNIKKYYNVEDHVIIQEPHKDVLLRRLISNIIGKFDTLSLANEKAAERKAYYQTELDEFLKGESNTTTEN